MQFQHLCKTSGFSIPTSAKFISHLHVPSSPEWQATQLLLEHCLSQEGRSATRQPI